MQLKELRSLLASYVDMDTGNADFEADMDRLISRAYEDLCRETDWSFLIREQYSEMNADSSPGDLDCTYGSQSCSVSGLWLIPSWTRGQEVEIDGKVYTVARSGSGSSVLYLVEPFEGSTGTYTPVFMHRYLYLPYEAESVWRVACGAEHDENSSVPDVLNLISATLIAESAIPEGKEGTPQGYFFKSPIPSYSIPRVDVVPAVSTAAGPDAWPEGTYYLSFSLKRGNSYGPPSEEMTLTVAAGEGVTIDASSAVDTSDLSTELAIWVRPDGYKRARLLDVDRAYISGANITPAFTFVDFTSKDPLDAEYDRAIALWPRSTSSLDIRLFYQVAARTLLDDFDTPVVPEAVAKVIPDLAAELFYLRANNSTAAAYHARRAEKVLSLTRGRYIMKSSRPPIEVGGWGAVQTPRIIPGRITKV